MIAVFEFTIEDSAISKIALISGARTIKAMALEY